MRLVLTTPPFNLFKDGYGSKTRIREGHLPPLGIGCIAAVTLKAGIETLVVDSLAMGLDLEGACDAIHSLKPDVIGISVITATASHAVRLAGMLKEKVNTPVIMGGPHATCFPEEVVRSPGIDYAVAGEGEKVILPLLKCISDKAKPRGLRGVVFKDGDSIVNNGKADAEYDLDSLDMPAYHLYRHELYSPLPYAYRKLPATSVITARGCPYSKCAFCFSAGKLKQGFRRNSPARVVSVIEELVSKYGMKEIIFADDNFLFNPKWIAEFCGLLKAEGIDISWSCAGRADTVNFEMLKNAKSAGCWGVFYGLESGVQRLLDTIKKGITLEEVERAIDWTHKAGLETRGSFMLALPGETVKDALETIDFAIRFDLDYAQFHATFPDLGTELFDIAGSSGRMYPYKGMNKATFVPEGYAGAEEVEGMVDLAYRRFYMRPGYVAKRVRSIRNLSDLSRYIKGFLFVRGLF